MRKWKAATPPRRNELAIGRNGRVKGGIYWRISEGEKGDDDSVFEIRVPEWTKVPFELYGVALVVHYGIEDRLYRERGQRGGEYFLTHLASLAYWAREEWRPGEFTAASTTWRRMLEEGEL